MLGKPKESTLLQAQSEYYKHWAVKMAQFQVSVDLFFFASECVCSEGPHTARSSRVAAVGRYMDVATISPISRFTGGQTYLYHGFNATAGAQKFRGDLIRNLTRVTVLLCPDVGVPAFVLTRLLTAGLGGRTPHPLHRWRETAQPLRQLHSAVLGSPGLAFHRLRQDLCRSCLQPGHCAANTGRIFPSRTPVSPLAV